MQINQKLFASNTHQYLECTKRKKLSEKYSYSQIFYKKTNSPADIGTMYHAALENLLTLENVNKEKITEFINSYCGDESKGIDKDFVKSIEGRNTIFYIYNLLNKIKSIKDFSSYKVFTEYEYLSNDLFYGKIDLLLRKDNHSILIDYKTGKKIFDKTGSFKEDIQIQLMIYQIMEIEEVLHSNINSYIYNKNAESFELKYDKSKTDFLKNQIFKLNSRYSKNEFLTGSPEVCQNCKLSLNCDSYNELKLIDLNELNVIHGTVSNIKKEYNNHILTLTSNDSILKNKTAKITIRNSDNLNTIDNLQLNQEIKLQNIRYLSHDTDQIRFIFNNYGSIFIKN